MSFTDDDGNAEGPIVSDAVPESGTVIVARGSCAADADWCTALTVGEGGDFEDSLSTNGFCGLSPNDDCESNLTSGASGFGALDVADFTLEGVTYTVQSLRWGLPGATLNETDLILFLNRNIPSGHRGQTTLKLGAHEFAFSDADLDQNPEDSRYIWSNRPAALLDIPLNAKLTVEIRSTAATGQPEITGVAHIGETLTASKGTIVDKDGVTKADNDDSGYEYTWQWVRRKNGRESNISGATASTYTLTGADLDSRIKVKARFTDDDDNSEGPLTSAAFPDSGAVSCANEDALWCATLVVENLGSGHRGCANNPGQRCSNTDRLSEDEFTYDSVTYEITTLQVRSGGQLRFWLSENITTYGETLVLYVDGETFAFSEASETNATNRRWNNSGLSWSTGDLVALELTGDPVPNAAGQPTVSGLPQVGKTLTADVSGISDPDGNSMAVNGDPGHAYTYQWVRVDTATSAETDIAGATASTYTLHADDAGHTVKVEVSFTDDEDVAEGPLASEAWPELGAVFAAPAACTAGAAWCTDADGGARTPAPTARASAIAPRKRTPTPAGTAGASWPTTASSSTALPIPSKASAGRGRTRPMTATICT